MIADKNNLNQINALLDGCSAHEIINWIHNAAKSPVVSTSFGPNSAVLLHLVTRVMPDIPVIWVDSGYNTNATYEFAIRLIERLGLNMKIYTPKATTAFLTVKMKGIPDIETQAHSEFTKTVKLEPFKRALDELAPDIWITGVRSQETEYRKSLRIVSPNGINRMKVAPILNWREGTMLEYICAHDLPIEPNYFDPTKLIEGRECGLHTRL